MTTTITTEKKGTPIGNNDLWIAAHALAAHLIVVTQAISIVTQVKHDNCPEVVTRELSSSQ